MKGRSNKPAGVSKKQQDFEAAFAKYSNKLPSEYVAQFKKNEPKGPSKDVKIKEATRMGKKVEYVQKSTGNKAHAQNLNVGKILDDTNVLEIKEVPKEIADQVKKIRGERKLSQEELGKKINEQASVIRDLENAEGQYDPKVVEKIEKFFTVKFDRSWKKTQV
jgi:ribosome-binding protein aMBF1 (putative translation factor)